jgi:hypothetical protein
MFRDADIKRHNLLYAFGVAAVTPLSLLRAQTVPRGRATIAKPGENRYPSPRSK